jgi:hypothetical protein
MEFRNKILNNGVINLYLNNPSALADVLKYNVLDKPLHMYRDEANNTLLHHIAKNNDESQTRMILEQFNRNDLNRLVNERNMTGQTPFDLATQNIIRLLQDSLEDTETKTSRFVRSVRNDQNGYNSDSDSFQVKFVGGQSGGYKKSKKAKKAKKSKKVKKSKRMSRSKSKSETDDIHQKVIDEFKKMTNSEEDARALKAALYHYVKTEHPDLKSKERADKMLEYLKDKTIVKKMESQLNEYREIIKNAQKKREEQQKSVNKNDTKAKKEPKEKQEKPKKAKKE